MLTLKVANIDWDLHINSNGDIEIAEGNAEIAQTVANKIQLFTKDAYFFQSRGIPHFMVDLGKRLPLSLARHEYRKAAMQTNNVKDAEANIFVLNSAIRGSIDITTQNGETVSVKV